MKEEKRKEDRVATKRLLACLKMKYWLQV